MPELSFKDYATDQEVRWCPGCGDYSILKAVQRSLAEAGAKPENTVFVSGIGCSSRLPYHVDTYGFHTIHGRAPAIAKSTATIIRWRYRNTTARRSRMRREVDSRSRLG